MDNELRNSFGNIIRVVIKDDDIPKDTHELERRGKALLDLKRIAINYCGANAHEILGLLINAQSGILGGVKLDIDKYVEECKLDEMWG